jgi:alpha-mannosidase
MSDLVSIEKTLEPIKAIVGNDKNFDRFSHEIRIAQRLVDAKPENKPAWGPLVDKALEHVEAESRKTNPDMKSAVENAENFLAPIGDTLKEYIIYCVGHAHIDMNWMWNWPETVSVTNDTFSTVDRLMDEFPDFKFSQSQASTYLAAKEYLPEVYEMIKRRVKEGRWEVTANTWVECEENIVSGEILCRHLLYTKRFMREELGFELDTVKLDWEPDLFGHPHTLPGILAKAGVKFYYFCRGGKGLRLFWWQSPDKSRVLAFDDAVLWYNGEITPDLTRLIFDFEKDTSLKEYLFVYGVGDHGGGPTRRDLMTVLDMNSWRIYPTVKLSTTDEFFSAIEHKIPDNLPVVDDELNFVFPGCYTSQSNIKRANRYGENRLVEAETLAVIGSRLLGMPYPSNDIMIGWRNTMFNQFHDILPGSGVHATYEYAQGLFQETLARTSMVKTRTLRTLASRVDTSGAEGVPTCTMIGAKIGPGIGAGAGYESSMGMISALSGGAVSAEPFLIYNPNSWKRDEMAVVTVWDKEIHDDRLKVVSACGKELPAQVIGRGAYWGHTFATIVFPVKELPAVGYRVYTITHADSPISSEPAVKVSGSNVIENEFFKLEVDEKAGSISSLVDKRLGCELVPSGKKMGVLQWLLEEPHGMTAWEIGKIAKQMDIDEAVKVEMVHKGPHLGTIRVHHKLNDSRFTLDISLKAGVPRVDFTLNTMWLERGAHDIGVPMLKVVFPVAVKSDKAKFDIPCGYIERPTNGDEVPAIKWVDLTGNRMDGKGSAGVTLVNESKYGHNVSESEIKLTLLRSSYDPDPLPEINQHEIKFAIVPHGENWNPSDSAMAGYEFNHCIEVVATDVHKGDLPSDKSFISIEPKNVMLSGIKKAEDTDEIVIRLYENDGKDTDAVVCFDPSLIKPNMIAMQTDILERPISGNTAKLEKNVLKVKIPAFSIVTVKIS